MQPPTRFVNAADGVRIGYCMDGSGPPLLFVRGWISHIERMWALPGFRSFFEALAERFTVIRYDTRGQGVSERDVDVIDFDRLTLDVEALVDRLDLSDVILYGQTFGGPIAITYAARHPHRVSKLILDGTYASASFPDDETKRTHEAFLHTLERMWPHSLSLLAQLTNPEPGDTPIDVRDDYGAKALRPEMAARLYRLAANFDVSDRLGELHMPVLVLHRRRSRSIPFRSAREMASQLPSPTFVALEGSAHNPWEGDVQATLDAIGDFLGAKLRLPERHVHASAPLAILFTDMESSTAMTTQLGDTAAQRLVVTHDSVVREALEACDGTEVKHTGDGIMASFTSISGAVECAVTIQRSLREHEAPFRVRVGIDAGEPLHVGSDLSGTVVQSARRIVDRAVPGQILVSDVVRRLVAGRRFEFVDRGRATLKGLAERVRLYEVPWEATPDQ